MDILYERDSLVHACIHEKKEFRCHNCKTDLCYHCAVKHTVILKHDVYYVCTHDEKIYHCLTCDTVLCSYCKDQEDHIHSSFDDRLQYSENIKLRCTHENKVYYCSTCWINLCLDCKNKHVIDSGALQHDVVSICTHHQRDYICRTCNIEVCSNCKDEHAINLLAGLHDIVLVCAHQNKEYQCRTCKKKLCSQCKDNHVVNSNAGLHDIVLVCSHQSYEFKCRTCEINLYEHLKDNYAEDLNAGLQDSVSVCSHQGNTYLCRTCETNLCDYCKNNHVVDANAGLHDIVLVCTHRNKKYQCITCKNKLCIHCKDNHVVDLNAGQHDIVLVCSHRGKEYYCQKCDGCLCQMCEETHSVNSNGIVHDILLLCAHGEKDLQYNCRECEKNLCYQCALKHIVNCDPNIHRLQHFCGHENKSKFCKTGEQLICDACYENHLRDVNGQFHELTEFCTHLVNTPNCLACIGKRITRVDIRSFKTEHVCPNLKYHCRTCKTDMCNDCKECHIVGLDTKLHDVVIKYEHCENVCSKHPNNNYAIWCSSCEVSLCQNCNGHEEHRIHDFVDLYETAGKKIAIIRGEVLPRLDALKIRLQPDLNGSNTRMTIKDIKEHDIPIRINELKKMIERITAKLLISRKSFISKVQNNEKDACICKIRHLEGFERKSEQSADKPVTFLKCFKKNTKENPFLCKLSDDIVTEFLCQIHINEKGKINVFNEHILELMPTACPTVTINVEGVIGCDHISCLTSDRIWIKNQGVLVLTDTTGKLVQALSDLPTGMIIAGHTITSRNELVYMNSDYNIARLSEDFNTKCTLITRSVTWKPLCVYSVPANGDILVGILNYIVKQETGRANVTRYNFKGKFIERIVHDSAGLELYVEPKYITANNNGDVIVSDHGRSAVVVVNAKRKLRFIYTGHPSGLGLIPHGICTNEMLQILVCDSKTDSIHIIDNNGIFLSYLEINYPQDIKPYSLCYDMKTRDLLVGQKHKATVICYKHITVQGTQRQQIRYSQEEHEETMNIIFENLGSLDDYFQKQEANGPHRSPEEQ